LTPPTRRGLLLAAGIFLSWLGSWIFLLPTTLSDLTPAVVWLAILVRTFLQTGLFIVAHDAMHGTLWPMRPGLNRLLGQLALTLYAVLPYGPCLRNHALHHCHAGSVDDPDSPVPGQDAFWRWYGRFMAAYVSPTQVAGLGVGWLVLAAVASPFSGSSLGNVLLYGALPALLSSLQLFVVGTYLPHRPAPPTECGDGHHQPRSLDLPTWLSLLSCFHFGYHWEHHAHPHLAWHELPAARQGQKGQGIPPPVRV
jgi:beta-carotene ketolase (CrtW type)